MQKMTGKWLVFFVLLYTCVLAVGPHFSPDHAPHQNAPVFWPAAGIYLAFLLHFRIQDWWKIALLAMLGGLLGGYLGGMPFNPNFLTMGITRASVYTLGAFVIRQLNDRFNPTPTQRVWIMVGIGGVLIPAFTACFMRLNVPPPHIPHTEMHHGLGSQMRMHFIGDSLGILTFTPFLLALLAYMPRPKGQIEWHEVSLNTAILAFVIVCALNIFTFDILPGNLRLPFMLFPLVVAISLLGKPGVTASANVVISLAAVSQAVAGRGFGIHPGDALSSLAIVQLFVGVTTLTQLLLTAAVQGRLQTTLALNERTAELQEVNAALEAAKAAALEASATKSRFLASMSHEIRSPLSAMLGFSDLLISGPAHPEDRRDFARIIKRNGLYLKELLDQILDLSKVEAGRIDLEKEGVDIRELIEGVLTLMEVRAAEKGLELKSLIESSVPATVWTDKLRLQQILINGLGNAIKFTDQGSVTLRVSSEQQSEGWELRCEIIDTGIGMTPDEQGLLFKAFSQANTGIARRYGGTGLGLDLSRQLARLLGGDFVLVSSTKDVGSTFALVMRVEEASPALPRIVRGKAKTMAEIRASQPLKGCRILLADDAPDSRVLVTRFLEMSGAMVDSVENGKKALEQAQASAYDLILLDLEMPVMDGLEAAENLRVNNYQGPLLALSGRAMTEDLEDCRKVGFNRHLMKPIDPQTLIAEVARLVGPALKTEPQPRLLKVWGSSISPH